MQREKRSEKQMIFYSPPCTCALRTLDSLFILCIGTIKSRKKERLTRCRRHCHREIKRKFSSDKRADRAKNWTRSVRRRRQMHFKRSNEWKIHTEFSLLWASGSRPPIRTRRFAKYFLCNRNTQRATRHGERWNRNVSESKSGQKGQLATWWWRETCVCRSEVLTVQRRAAKTAQPKKAIKRQTSSSSSPLFAFTHLFRPQTIRFKLINHFHFRASDKCKHCLHTLTSHHSSSGTGEQHAESVFYTIARTRRQVDAVNSETKMTTTRHGQRRFWNGSSDLNR